MAMDDDNNSSNSNGNASINEVLPAELLQVILLRLSIKHLARLRCVSKLWRSLISDPNFAKSHLELSPLPTHKCVFIQSIYGETRSAELDAVFRGGHLAAESVSVPLKKQKRPLPGFHVLGSCRGFVVLQQYPHSFIVWNPLTGSHKRISYYNIVRKNATLGGFRFVSNARLFGFGYDASQDDYLVVLAWRDGKNEEDHFDFFSLRTNSWRSFEVALPIPLKRRHSWDYGLFFNGAIHWLIHPVNNTCSGDTIILVFDMKERSFSDIPLPEQAVVDKSSRLVTLGGCLALYNMKDGKTEIWVMKEYKVESSWTLYEILSLFQPICLSNGGDIIGFVRPRGLTKYNVKGELLQHYAHFHGLFQYDTYTMYTESLVPLPNDSEEEKKRKGWGIVSYYKMPLKQVLVIFDDLDAPFAKLRLLPKGVPGGLETLNAFRSK